MYFASRAIGGYPFVGSPDRIADELADLSRSGVRGIAVSMINDLNELPLFRDDVLPRLERFGARAAHNSHSRKRQRLANRASRAVFRSAVGKFSVAGDAAL
jgi:hypothetical protein